MDQIKHNYNSIKKNFKYPTRGNFIVVNAVFDICVYAIDKIDTIISCPDMNHYELSLCV